MALRQGTQRLTRWIRLMVYLTRYSCGDTEQHHMKEFRAGYEIPVMKGTSLPNPRQLLWGLVLWSMENDNPSMFFNPWQGNCDSYCFYAISYSFLNLTVLCFNHISWQLLWQWWWAYKNCTSAVLLEIKKHQKEVADTICTFCSFLSYILTVYVEWFIIYFNSTCFIGPPSHSALRMKPTPERTCLHYYLEDRSLLQK